MGPFGLGPHRPAAQGVLGELVVLVEDDGPLTGEVVVDVQQLDVAVVGRQGDVEGFGLPVIEAMACGLPVVAARAAAVPEIAGDAALLVEPGDEAALASGLDRLASDAAQPGRLREAGLRRAKTFTWEACAEEHAAAYRAALGG